MTNRSLLRAFKCRQGVHRYWLKTVSDTLKQVECRDCGRRSPFLMSVQTVTFGRWAHISTDHRLGSAAWVDYIDAGMLDRPREENV